MPLSPLVFQKSHLFIIAFALTLSNASNAETPREQLQQMVEQLQRSPDDNALREQIIQLARTLKPAPAVPDGAKRHMAYGTAAIEGAKSVADYQEAAKEFEQTTLATPKSSESFRDCPDCPEMVVIPAGGSGSAFALGKYEVTQGRWRAIMGNNPSYFSNCGDDCPVEQVSWNDAQDFIRRLNSKTGKQYRLPSEAEWEYACRAGAQQEYCGSDNADSVAWYVKNSGDTTHPAGRKQPNAFGLYDMSGNVWEWVEGCYNGDCSRRVLRGGSWYVNADYLRAAVRVSLDPGGRYYSSGFRVARTLP